MSLLTVCAHGGLCCGIKHLRGFGNYSTRDGTKEEFVLKSLEAVVKGFVPDAMVGNGGMSGCPCTACENARALNTPEKVKEKQESWITAVECVLAGGQYVTWKDTLVTCGFKEVFSFKNSNSRNMCHVFYGTTNPVLQAVTTKETKSVESAPEDTEIAV